MTPPTTESPIRRAFGAIKRFIDANTAFAEGEPSAPLSTRPATRAEVSREDDDDGLEEIMAHIRAHLAKRALLARLEAEYEQQHQHEHEHELELPDEMPPACAQVALGQLRSGEWAGRTAVEVLDELPMDDAVMLTLRWHAQAGHWPGPPFLAALARALQSVLELALNDDDLALLEDQTKSHGALVSYLTAALGQSTPTHWHHNLPPASMRPIYPVGG
jgi:hypothetical protein